MIVGLGSAAAITMISVPPMAGEPPAISSGPDTNVEQVIVTASKRAQALKDAPTAVTALTSSKIETFGLDGFDDYMGYVPSLEFNGNGAPGVGAIIIRGINSGYSQVSQTVGYYIDEIPFTETSTGYAVVNPDPDLTDVDRIEVLKGPQSTLFGASSLGGLIRIITHAPDLDRYSGEARIDGVAVDGGGDGGGVHGLVNIPIVPNALALRINALDRLDPGYVDNVQTGRNNVNTSRIAGGRIALRFDPNAKTDIEFTAFLQDQHSAGTAQEDVDPTSTAPIEGKYKYASYFNPTIYTQYMLYSLNGTYSAQWASITNATAYSEFTGKSAYDFTNAYAPLFYSFGAQFPNQALAADFQTPLKKFTEELRFNSTRLGPVELQGGLFYTHEQATYDAYLIGKDGTDGVKLPQPYDNFSTGLQSSSFEEYAAYADATYYILETLDVTVGVRQSRNIQRADVTYSGLLTPPQNTPSSSSESDTSYLFTIRWRPSEDLSAYARAASAYRPGGPQYSPSPAVPSSFGPDKVWNYEIGAKSVWAAGRISADADLYYIRWTNIQLDALLGGLTVTGNGGDAHSEGAEFQLQASPIQRLKLTAGLAYDQTRMDSVNPNNTAGAVVGDPLPYTPKWSGSLTADYGMPVAKTWVSVGASYIYQGARESSFSADTINSRVDLRQYQLINLRARVDWERYSLIFRIDNIANIYDFANVETVRLFPGQSVNASAVPLQPRTFRLSLEARF